MPTTEEKQAAIVRSLYRRTKAGDQHWSLGSSDNQCATSVGLHTIIIAEEGPDFSIYIYDDEGVVLDSFTDVTIKEQPTGFSDLASFYLLMKELYRTASREASGAEAALDLILDQLELSDSET